MQNRVSIYKFHFPFLESQYENTKKESFISNIREFLLYEELSPKVWKQKKWEMEYITLEFLWGRFEFFYYDSKDYFIPIFQCQFFLDENNLWWEEKIIHKLLNITRTLGKQDYIYDIDLKNISHRKEDILTTQNIQKSFSKIDISNIQNFIENVEKKNMQEYLQTYFDIKFSLMYMMYLCYIFYYNMVQIHQQKKDLEECTWKSSFVVEDLQLNAAHLRLSHLQDMNMVQFKKYFDMLQTFFQLFY